MGGVTPGMRRCNGSGDGREEFQKGAAGGDVARAGGRVVSAAQGGGDGFRMTLYSGANLRHWCLGRVVLDVKGFRLDLQDVPAMRNHWRDETAGYTTRLTAEGKMIAVEGRLLTGREEERTVCRNRM